MAEQLTVRQMSNLNATEIELFAQGTLTRKQVMKKAENRRYAERHGKRVKVRVQPSAAEEAARSKSISVARGIELAEAVSVTLTNPSDPVAQKEERRLQKAAYIKAWRAKHRVRLAAEARAKYHAAKKTSANVPDHVVTKARKDPEHRAAVSKAVAKAKKLAYQRAWRAKKRAAFKGVFSESLLEARVAALEGKLQSRSLLQRLVGNLFRI